MSTLDKINSELLSLQEELSKLKHYSDEIGKAKEASATVVKMSIDFLDIFKKRVESINKEMENAAVIFKKKTTESSASLEESSKAFQKGINDAKATLSDVGAELSIVAEKINGLALQIEAINILGQFEKVNLGISNLQTGINKVSEQILSKISLLEENINKLNRKSGLIFYVIVSGLILLLAVTIFSLIKPK